VPGATEVDFATPVEKSLKPISRVSSSSPVVSLLSLSLGTGKLASGSSEDTDSVHEYSSIGGDSDCLAATVTSGDEPSPLPTMDCPLNLADEMAKNALALHDAQMEIERDGPISQTGNGTPCTKVGLQDFELLSVVGQGAFGKVFQVRHKATDKVYALKVMRKEKILQKDHSEYVRSERDVLTSVQHPFIVTLRFSFQTPSKLYLVLDFINGGHLFYNLFRQGVFSEGVARLYCAEMVLALSYLHSNNIMHRDLKPENVLLDSEGHIKLTDFGLAKGNVEGDNERSNSFIGTMEYMAPEIVDGKGHTKGVDWWSTGVLLYEMLCGLPPFRAKSRNALQQQILTAKPKYPKFLSSDALNLLKGLLTRDPLKRLGCGPNGAEDIKKHPFFKTINWVKLERGEVQSTFKPTVKCSMSVENFDKIWTDQKPEDSPCGTPSASADAMFRGFTYVQPSYLLGLNLDNKMASPEEN
jgi:p70 ribosomal S6 kinase